MPSDLVIRLAAVAVLVLLSAFFSGSETALFSLSRVARARMRQSGRRIDRLILALTARPRRLIATILVGNELVNISISTLVAALVEQRFAPRFGPVELTLLSTAIALPLLLLLCEITPKSIAIKAAEGWSRIAARPVALAGYVVAPLRWIVRGIADAVLWLIGQRPAGPQHSELKEAEFRALVDLVSREGEIEETEQRLIHNVFEFGDRTAGDIMTPAERVFSLPHDWSLPRMLEEVQKSRYSRIPVYRKSKDNIVGILLARDLVGLARGQGPARARSELLLAPYYVPKAIKCDLLFRQMQRRKTHMAVVVNEYGRTVGLVTMEDLLEELFGEITDEKEAPRRAPRVEERAAARPAEAPSPAAAGPPSGPGEPR